MSDWTAERPASGLVVYQPARGFRYAVDAYWLAGFALEPGVPRTALDLGTGSGIVAFLLARAGAQAVGLDRWAGWTEGWTRSLQASAHRPTLRLLDACEHRAEAGYELVTCNPPYAAAGTGPVPPDPGRAVARVESTATLADFLRAAATALAPSGRAVFVLPSARAAEAIAYAAPCGLGLVRRLVIGPRALLDLRPGGSLVEDLALPRDHARVRGFIPERP